jgi:hypothetical protein
LTNSVQPYWRFATQAMQMTPMINCVHGFASSDRAGVTGLEFVFISSPSSPALTGRFAPRPTQHLTDCDRKTSRCQLGAGGGAVLGGATGPTLRGVMACAGIRVARSTRGLQSHPDEGSRKIPTRAHSLTYMPPNWPGSWSRWPPPTQYSRHSTFDVWYIIYIEFFSCQPIENFI